ncbi:hypothetical protein [Roseococcus pinisoli]|uniref:Lipoprotein n=1 Tax=Roseococcus pinisoli TaxID=2835040 RepID=A0ABS5QBN9_9PROT|nr:hypothetical protein [Roseococcus pinisoli]MBS7811109.1 hypothetical protein [Roseococcus pinisoli]
MRKLLPVLALSSLLGFAACTDPYGRPDPLATGLLGAGIGAAAGLAIASASQPRYHGPRYASGYGYGRPSYGYGYGRRGW